MHAVGSGNELALSPAPALGFSGAAALDADGKFAGHRTVEAGARCRTRECRAAAQAALVPAETVREFLKANGVTATAPTMQAAVVRVICVRKRGRLRYQRRPQPRNPSRSRYGP